MQVLLDDPRFSCDISKSSARAVVVQSALSACEATGTAKDTQAFPGAVRIGPRQRGVFQIELNVVGDEQIQVAVAIVIQKSAASAPLLACDGQSNLLGYVFEAAVTEVAVQDVMAEVSHEQIGKAVVIVVARAHALCPSGLV